MSEGARSYDKILRATSIMGGAAGVTLVLGMLRVKAAALMTGMTGVGLIASLTAVQGLVATLAGLGIQSSAVRDVAVAMSRKDQAAIGNTVLALRRVCWLTGLAGMIALVLLAPLISRITFGNDGHALAIAALGFVILLSNVSGGQLALIQGARRIGDMARVNIFSGLFGTAAAIGFYAWLGLQGIVPALIAVAAMQLAASWYFARKVPVPPSSLGWRQTFGEARAMIGMGVVFMWRGLLTSVAAYLTVMLITRQAGLQAVGLYSAAFALSGIFVNFILGAMAADYYPRLAGLAGDAPAMNRLVNEQTDIGLLLALPGLLATLAMSPWLVQLFYSREFLAATEPLQWFILGCMARVISWPLGFVMLALGQRRWYFASETGFNVLSVLAVALVLPSLEGVGMAFFVVCGAYIIGAHFIAKRLTGFRWSGSTLKIGLIAAGFMAATFLAVRVLTLWPATIMGLCLTSGAAVYSLRETLRRIDPQNRIVQAVSTCRIPGVRAVCGL